MDLGNAVEHRKQGDALLEDELKAAAIEQYMKIFYALPDADDEMVKIADKLVLAAREREALFFYDAALAVNRHPATLFAKAETLSALGLDAEAAECEREAERLS